MGCSSCGDDDSEEKFDIKQGPNKSRGCTDIICCIAYLAFIGFWLAIGAVAFQNGNPTHILLPTDSAGNVCGEIGTAVENKPFMMYFDITKCASLSDVVTSNLQCPTYQKCVETCPDKFWSYYTNMWPAIQAFDLQIGAPGLPLDGFLGELDEEGRCPADCTLGPCICLDDLECKPQFQSKINEIKNGIIPDAEVLSTVNGLIENGDCAPYSIVSAPTMKRCLPALSTDADEANGNLTDANIQNTNRSDTDVTFESLSNGLQGLIVQEAEDFFRTSVADLKNTWPMILIILGIAIVVSFLWIVLMRWIAAPLIWFFIFGLLGLLGFGVYFTYTKYAELKDDNIQFSTLAKQFTFNFAAYLQSYEVWLAFMIILAVILTILLLLLLFFCKRIRIATRLIGEASKAVGAIMSTLFFPLFSGCLYVIVICWFAATAAYIATSATPVFQEFREENGTYGDECDINEWNNPDHPFYNDSSIFCLFTKYKGNYGWTEETIVVQLVNLFGFYWAMNFVTAINQMTLAGAFASWYFAFKKPDDVPTFALTNAFFRSFYHFGTMAFGALIIAIIQIFRAILNYIERKTKRTQNGFTKCLICFCKCCLWCLEKCLRYISKNAYILTAIYGYNFCKASCKAVKLIIANAARAVALDGTTELMLFIGKLLVAVGCAAFTWAFFAQQFTIEESWLQMINVDPDAINSVWLPTVIVFFGSYLIATGFFNVYSMAVSTIFLCFLEDLERNDGSPQKPYFMDKSLKKLLGKKNKKAKETSKTSPM